MTEENEYGWNLLMEGAETMIKLGKLKQSGQPTGLSVEYDPIEKENTTRRNIRVHEDQLEWADNMIETDYVSSRELLYKACAAFAQHNEKDFLKFLLRCNVDGYSSLASENQNEPSDSMSDSTSTEEERTEESTDEDKEQEKKAHKREDRRREQPRPDDHMMNDPREEEYW